MTHKKFSKDLSGLNRSENTKESSPIIKKTYQAPAWQVEEIFEKMALGCAKADDFSCAGGPIQS